VGFNEFQGEKNMQTKVYVFDLDGTIIDSVSSVKELTYRFHTERGITIPEDIMATILPLGYPKTAEYYVKAYHLQETPKEIEKYLIGQMTKNYEERIPAKGSADEVLRALKERGVILAVLTASPRIFLDPCVQRLGWASLLDYTWSVEEFNKTKGDPTLFTDVANLLGVKAEECCMIDDSAHSLRSAGAAGWKTVGIYDEVSNADILEEMYAVSDVFVRDLKEIL
jgi:HAD superfamily hydrolase (TIGR01509 family)